MVNSLMGGCDASPGFVRKVRRRLGIAFDHIVWSLDKIFDYRFGTDTSGITRLKDLRIPSRHVIDAVDYEPIPNNLFKRAMGHLVINYQNFTFVDLGSGKGRALLLASHFPFAKIIGVEFSGELNRIAKENLLRYKARHQLCRDRTSVCADATEFELPDTNLVVFLHNPFTEAVMTPVAKKIDGVSRRHAVYVIYCEATCSSALDALASLPYRRRLKLPRLVLRRPGAYSSLLLYSNRALMAGFASERPRS